MAKDDLTPAENALLIVLMAEAREISNVELRDRYRIELTGARRRKLNELRYVASVLHGRTYAHQLDDEGWVRVHDELDFEGKRASVFSAALTALHGNLRDRVLGRHYLKFSEMFARPKDLGVRIREEYASLARKPGGWVSLTRLRPLFNDVSRDDLDDALRQLDLALDVNIVPESNQKALTDKDHDAALLIGGQKKHLLAIGV